MVTFPNAAVELPEQKVARGALLTDLRAACTRLRITQQAIADRCEVTRPFVVNLFAGRRWSSEVVATIRTMVAEAEKKAARRKRGNGT